MWCACGTMVYAALAAQLTAVEVSIAVAPARDSVTVRAQYRLATSGDSIRFRLAPARGRRVWFDGERWPPERPGAGDGHLVHLVAGRDTGEVVVTLEHAVVAAGAVISRVPLFVPDRPSDPAAVDVVGIRVRGLGASAHLGGGFPRLTRAADGSARSSLANLPSFVLLPPEDVWVSTNRVADASVVLLLVLGTAVWIARQRRG